MYAAVDLGSNSFRLHIGKHDGEAIRVLKSMREPIRLAAGLDGAGNLTEAAMQTALACLKNFSVTLAAYELDAVRVVATSAMRVARNGAVFLPLAEQAIGYPIEIISGEEEARLIYMGVANALALPGERRLVMDIGGGSTELILGRGQDTEGSNRSAWARSSKACPSSSAGALTDRRSKRRSSRRAAISRMPRRRIARITGRPPTVRRAPCARSPTSSPATSWEMA